MKKYLLGLFAVALAVGFSAFTNPDSLTKKRGIVFLEYIGGTQTNIASFNQTTIDPLLTCELGSTVCYIKVNDANNVITQTEWYNVANPNAGYFEALDVVSDPSNTLNDEAVTANFKKKP